MIVLCTSDDPVRKCNAVSALVAWQLDNMLIQHVRAQIDQEEDEVVWID